jgi:hypothetical protein
MRSEGEEENPGEGEEDSGGENQQDEQTLRNRFVPDKSLPVCVYTSDYILYISF